MEEFCLKNEGSQFFPPKNLGATSTFHVPEWWREAIFILRTHCH